MFISEKLVEVRYAETDAMGVVYHANYLVWFEIGRTQLIKDLGFNYAEMESEGVISPVIDLNVSYKKSLRYGQTAKVKTKIKSVSPLKVIYEYEIVNENEEICCVGNSTHVLVQKETFRPIKFKKMYPEWYEAYEKAMGQE
ncbi:acyl-CoA thioesterase [Gottfriedia luciferensis]|uniref:acyl-CoA thioesterase n=1 Tax=Gottfriedia luciferensis TaxID=178774 RepID=UPI000B44D63B|nr:thioesterase family protein [Gottfriedia luciferensis]